MSRAKRYFAWQGELVLPYAGQRVVEVGAGIGNFTKLLVDREVVYACDVESACVEQLRNRYLGYPNLHCFVGEPHGEAFKELETHEIDTCLCINVLEHIADDLSALQNMAAVLRPGGRLILLVPAFPILWGPIDRNLEHQRRYKKSDVRKLAAACGLSAQRLRYWNVVGFFGWFWNARVIKRQAQSSRQIRIFDSFVVPVMSRVERLIPPPFGQSLFAVLQKPLSSDT